jgi:hypothetical protein
MQIKTLPFRDMAKQTFLTKTERDQAVKDDEEFTLEARKAQAMMDLRAIADTIGYGATKDWIEQELPDLMKYPSKKPF